MGVYVRTAAHSQALGVALHGNTNARQHGDRPRSGGTPEYNAWQNMRARCTNVAHPKYPRYGGRGITICDRWSDFANFLADMGRRPAAGYSLERIDNDGNYEPGNCHWATAAAQQQNTCRTKLDAAGADLIRSSVESTSALARRFGVSRRTVQRIRAGEGWR